MKRAKKQKQFKYTKPKNKQEQTDQAQILAYDVYKIYLKFIKGLKK